jgi:hypothetical protein
MIPYLLAIAGGYLIGNATKDKQLFAKGDRIKGNYKIFEGYDYYNGIPLFKVVGIDNEYDGEWHISEELADEELKELESKYAKGGIVEISSTRKNIMGTLSFKMKIAGMRKEQEFIVYPIQMGDSSIKIQSDTRIGMIDMESGKGIMSQSHQSGAYGHHLSTDKLIPFELSQEQLISLKEKIRETAGSNVGSSIVKSDNLGASQFANGGIIANTILSQLGGANRLNAMTGAYNFLDLGNGLSFKIKNQRANYIKIILNGKDLYDVEVGRIRGTTYKVVKTGNDLYFDQLKEFIENATGMYLSL